MKVVGIIIGAIIGLVSLPFLLLGIGIVGYVGDGTGVNIPLNGLRVPPKVIAVTSPEFSVTASDLPSQVRDASVTFHVTPQPGGAPLFVGLAPSQDVQRYLKGATTAHLEPADANATPGEVQPPNPQDVATGDGIPVRLQVEPGKRKRVAPPAKKAFWIRQADSATGDITVGVQDISGKNLRIVIMRVDGRPGIAVDASMRIRIPFLKQIGWLTLGIGLAIAALAFGLIIWMIILIGRPKKLAATGATGTAVDAPTPAEPGVAAGEPPASGIAPPDDTPPSA